MITRKSLKTPGRENETMPIQLAVRNISKSYPGVQALTKVELTVRKGEVHALLGENGAGKSTLSSIIAGLVQADSGEMEWLGEIYKPSTPRDAMDRKIGLIHQELKLLPRLSIAENVFVGRIPVTAKRLINRKYMQEESARQLQQLGLSISTKLKAGKLSVAQQQLVEIAKAMTLNAKLLILDEPTAALGSKETEKLFELIHQLKESGVSFIYISHRLEEIARISDRITVLRDGHLIATHENADLPVKTLVEEMVGRKIDTLFPALAPLESHKEVLRVRNLTSSVNAFRNINFSVREGEIFGIAGIVGAGRSEVIRAIIGADPISSGEIILDSKPLRITHPYYAIKAGMVMVPEDRKLQGLILKQSLAENFALCNYDILSRKGWIKPSAVMSFARQLIREYGIKGFAENCVEQLSGGNQQKVLIAKWVSRSPKVILLDEPTRGVDVGARNAIYTIIRDLAARGISVVIVSSELEEVLGMSHRIMVLSRGVQRGILDREEADNIRVMELAAT